ncbi:heavy metal translocating P-type ATPase [Pseudoalteromonas tunicata]|uniref:heavy metal translocating P-type ATPase n=1 Tax=Pseudoalteromonas tunicata TaxID=314281 RepID=UPI00273ECDC0|nr:heavy metal translocating P-type ATPase [Pseudoalteromonas tunicata]MDP4983352.1 heavy metal translocating P-type ATPase [Pseudoalteromonas tunicata]
MSDVCFHCLEPIPLGFKQSVEFNNQQHAVCCLGCQAVAQAIIQGGMTDYYKFRTEAAGKVKELIPEQLAMFKSYDDEDIQADFITGDQDNAELLLSIEGISCAACAWLIEKQLLGLQGVLRVDVNTSTHRALIYWHRPSLKLSRIIEALAKIGYQAYPFQADEEELQKKQVAKSYIRRLGVAGLMTMQVMMFAFAMYFGMFSGMDEDFEQYFRWISFTLATPVILYSAMPFLTNAVRGLQARQLNMDLPVSLAIFGAYAASSWATFFETGEVYFESICMFTFLLLLGKYLEFRARLKATEFTANLQKLLPLTARLASETGEEKIIAAKKLQLGDIIFIKPGETIPADGLVVTGKTSVDESMMTGEHQAVAKSVNDQVFAGTINHDGVITVKINQIGGNTLLNQIVKLQHQALASRPKIAEVTDKVAQWFVATLLVFASITAAVWYNIDPSHAFWITIAVLVATCPCALSLAIPTALTCSVANLTQKGVLIKKSHVLETLTKIDAVAFDKTGTLTEGRFTIKRSVFYGDAQHDLSQQAHLMALARALEHHSEHPIAKAFCQTDQINTIEISQTLLSGVEVHTALGISAIYQGQSVAIGKNNWFAEVRETCQAVLYIDNQAVAAFELSDKTRDHAKELVHYLDSKQISCHLLTGDPSPAGLELATQLAINHVEIGCSPRDKQQHVAQLIQQGKIVAMIGDGVNDSPVFNTAHLSIAMATGADISKNTADVVLLNSDLNAVKHLHQISIKTRRIIKQNLTLSLLYNGSILPLAAMGLIPPWIAVIGMSASSIIVITNSLRLLKI